MNLAKNGAEVKVLNLTKKFGNHRVLHETNLELIPGEFVAIVGRSGCGKSTLLRLIAGLDRPSEGVVEIDGESVKQLNRSARVMFQDSRLLMWKRVLENVSLGLPKRWQERARWALQQVGLDERANDYPAVLSGGQRQRVALARALVSEPRLLLLDEPLGALDALTRIEMQRLIEQIWQEQQFTAMLVTHDVEEAVMLGDRVVLIEAGKITMNLPITFSRPRQRGDAAFAATVEHILERVLNTGTTRREYADIQENLALAESRILN